MNNIGRDRVVEWGISLHTQGPFSHYQRSGIPKVGV